MYPDEQEFTQTKQKICLQTKLFDLQTKQKPDLKPTDEAKPTDEEAKTYRRKNEPTDENNYIHWQQTTKSVLF